MPDRHFVYLDAQQIESIVDKLIPIIATGNDEAVMRFYLTETFARTPSAQVAVMVQKILSAAYNPTTLTQDAIKPTR